MQKLLNRIIYLNLLIGYIFIPPFTFSGYVDEMSLREKLIGVWILLSILSMLYLWIFMFYHLAKHKFKKPGMKKIWLLVLVLGGILKFYGPMIYYPIVVEFKKTLEQE